MAKVNPEIELNEFNKANTSSVPVNLSFFKKSLNLTPNVILSVLIGTSSLVLAIGLISGLVLRPDNCIEKITEVTTLPTTILTTSKSTTSSSTTFSSTSSLAISSSSINPATSAIPGTTAKPTTTVPVTTIITTSTLPPTTTETVITNRTDPRTIPTLTTLTTPTTQPIISSDYRLPDHIQPTNYKLNLKTYFDPYENVTEYFEGSVDIKFSSKKASNIIILHVDESLIISDKIEIYDAANILIETVNNDLSNYAAHQLYQLRLNKNLPMGNDYRLAMKFSGKFGTIDGFFTTRYREDSKIKTVLATQFQPTSSRAAFPCFDEPSFKATFDITIEHPAETIAISNWPVDKTTQDPVSKRKTTEFQTTQQMSTYLAAWVVVPDDYDSITKKTFAGKDIKVYARKTAVKNKQVEFALDTAALVIDYFESQYFLISDAIPPKIDLIALPDYSVVAMEHWGMISFPEGNLLYLETENSVVIKQEIALIVAHELAHFWFGNYVTCGWWDDLWLNEAMAEFLSYKAVQNIYPDLDIADQFIVDKLVQVMHDDGFDYSRNVASTVNRPEEISGLFNTFTYDKGASILFMLESAVGEVNFKDALISYLKANPFGTGSAKDFYDALIMPKVLSDASIKGSDFMDDFLNQINFPLVSVSLDHDAQNDTTIIILEQKRFLNSILNIDLANITSRFNYTWKLFVQCQVGGQYNQADLEDYSQHLGGSVKDLEFYLGTHSSSFIVNGSFSWIKCNKGFRGYYLTDYSEENFKAVEHVLANSPANVFSIGDRAHLIHSAFTLGYSGIKNYGTASYLTSYMETKESDYVPWRTYFLHLERLATLLEHRGSFKGFRDFAIVSTKSLMNNNDYSDLWSSTGNHLNQLLKIKAIDLLCRFQDEQCLNKATELFRTISEDFFYSNSKINPVSPNFRAQVYKYHIQNTNEYFDWYLLDFHYYLSNDPHEMYNALTALSHHRSTWLLDGLLSELFSSENTIKNEHFFEMIAEIGENTAGRHQAWNFVRRYYDKIVAKFGNSAEYANTIKRICKSFTAWYLEDEMSQFFASTAAGEGYLVRKQTEDIVTNNLFWIRIREKDVTSTFSIPFRFTN